MIPLWSSDGGADQVTVNSVEVTAETWMSIGPETGATNTDFQDCNPYVTLWYYPPNA